jgi:hypothetical protein
MDIWISFEGWIGPEPDDRWEDRQRAWPPLAIRHDACRYVRTQLIEPRRCDTTTLEADYGHLVDPATRRTVGASKSRRDRPACIEAERSSTKPPEPGGRRVVLEVS